MIIALDTLLAAGLLWLGWQVVSGRTLFRSIVMFVVFGLLMAVVWARLGSPDLALAEAAVSAGVTGAMLMLTYRRLIEMVPERAGQLLLRRSRLAAPVGTLCGVLVLSLGWTLMNLPASTQSAGHAAVSAMRDQEIGNPVTGVLLLFRGFDTLLEMTVLLAAWLGAKLVQDVARPEGPSRYAGVPLVNALLAVVIPGAVLVAGYLLHAGGQAPGGAFQAGSVLAAAGVLLALSGRIETLREPLFTQRVAVVMGIVVFAALCLSGPFRGLAVMSLPGIWAVYVIEGALTISIAMCLLLLFLGAGGLKRKAP